jgi:hypothetical protein
LEILQEAAKLLTPLPNDSDINTMFRIYWHTFAAEGQKAEVRKPIAEFLLTTVRENPSSNHYLSTLYNPPPSFQPTDIDRKLYEEARLMIKGMNEPMNAPNAEPYVRATRLTSILHVAYYLFPPGSKERKEAYNEAFKAAMEIPRMEAYSANWYNSRGRRRDALGGIVPYADKDEISDVLDELVIETLHTERGRAALEYRGPTKRILPEYVRSGNTDRMLELIYSDRLADRDKNAYLYLDAAHALLDAKAPPDDKFRADEFKKLFGMLRNANADITLIDAAKRIPKRFSWYPSIQEVQALSDPVRLEMCLLMISVHCEQKTDVDVKPFLECLETNVPKLRNWQSEVKIRYEMLVLVQRYSLWGEKKLADWSERYVSAVETKVPADGRFYSLYQLFDAVVKKMPLDDAAKGVWLDRLHVAAKSVFEPDDMSAFYDRDRFDAFRLVAQEALDADFPDRAQKAIDEGVAYRRTLPPYLQNAVWIGEKVRRLELLRDNSQKNSTTSAQ